MKRYMSEARAVYEDMHHGLFSKKLAEWAISHMETQDVTTKELKKLKAPTLDETWELLKANKIELPEEFIYTAWYLYAMSMADYPKALTTNEQRALFVKETLLDQDCCPEAVLECFVAKMCVMEIPIYWEKYL